MQPLEIEVKYLVTDPDALKKKILDAGWQSLGNHFERNIRFEDDHLGLIEKKQLLRLRQDQKATLTFKSKPAKQDPRYKIHHEIEVTVSDFNAMQSILEALGYHKEQVYEKWRETFGAGRAVICLDRMPFGCFMEIEGPEEDIVSISKTLGFPPDKAITENYLAIFSYIKEKEGLSFNDITFDHFKPISKDFTACLRTLEIGKNP